MTNQKDESTDIVVAPSTSSIDKRLQSFSSLLSAIQNIDDKTRQLWQEIYENAICDRQNAYAMFMKLALIADDKSTEHAVHGRAMSSYIERMQKANEQLIRLAELVSKVSNSEEPINADDVFDRIKKGRGR